MNEELIYKILHELDIEIIGYQTQMEMIQFLEDGRKRRGLTFDEQFQIQHCTYRIKRLQDLRQELLESGILQSPDEDSIENLYSDSDDPREI